MVHFAATSCDLWIILTCIRIIHRIIRPKNQTERNVWSVNEAPHHGIALVGCVHYDGKAVFEKRAPMTPSLLQLHNAITVTSVHLRPMARIRRMTHLIQQNVMRGIPHAFKQRLECLSCHKRSFTKPIQSGCFHLAVGILLDLEVISLFIKKKKAKFHEFETIKIQRKLKDSNHHSLRFQTGRPKFRSSPAAGLLTRQQIVVEAKAKLNMWCQKLPLKQKDMMKRIEQAGRATSASIDLDSCSPLRVTKLEYKIQPHTNVSFSLRSSYVCST